MHEALAVRARHRRVDLGDDAAGNAQNRRRKIHGHSETDVASGIGRGHLKQGHVDRQPPARQEFRHLLERNRHVVELAACGEALYVAADEERPMAVPGLGGARLHRQRRRGDEAHELEVGQAGLHPLQPREQAARRSAPGAEIDAAARLDRRQRLLQANELRSRSQWFPDRSWRPSRPLPDVSQMPVADGRVSALPVQQASPRVSEAAPSARPTDLGALRPALKPSLGRSPLIHRGARTSGRCTCSGWRRCRSRSRACCWGAQ